MSDDQSQCNVNAMPVDARKLRSLRAMVKLMLCLGAGAALYVAFSVGSTQREAYDTPSLRVYLNQIEPGRVLQLLWDGRPIIIVHRSDQQLAALASQADLLVDANSEQSNQPSYANNMYRSIDPQWFVAFASGTDLGCSLRYLDERVPVAGKELLGALQDSCAGSYYDLAGRVLLDQSATENLRVPEYSLRQGEIVLGVSQR